MPKAKRPPVGINPNIPIETQRDLRKVAGFAFDAQDNANTALEGLAGKVSKTPADLLQVAQFVSKQVGAGGAYPLNLTGLPGAAANSVSSIKVSGATVIVSGAVVLVQGTGISIVILGQNVTISLAASGVTAGTYATGKVTSGGTAGSITVDAYGRITAITAAT